MKIFNKFAILMCTCGLLTSPFTSIAFKFPKLGVEASLSFKAGHDLSQCGGAGEICMIAGTLPRPCHIPCVSFGSNCEFQIKISFRQALPSNGNGEEEIDVDTNVQYEVYMHFIPASAMTEQFFTMPARSIVIPNTDIFVNIPSQVSQLSNSSGILAYPLSGVIFTTTALHSNN